MVHGDAFRQKAENVDKLLDSFGFTLNNHGFWCRKHHRHDNPCHKCLDRLACPGTAPRRMDRREIREREFTEGSAPQYDWVLMRLTGWFGPSSQLNEHLYAEICEDTDKSPQNQGSNTNKSSARARRRVGFSQSNYSRPDWIGDYAESPSNNGKEAS